MRISDWSSDVCSSDLSPPRVRIVDAFPDEATPPIVYPLAIVAGRDSPAVRAAYDFLRSDEATAIFAKHGFTRASAGSRARHARMLELTPLELAAIGLSLKVALGSLLVSLPYGVDVAWLLGQ